MPTPDRQPSSDPLDMMVIPIGLIVVLFLAWMVHRDGLYYGAGKMAYYMLMPLDFIPDVATLRRTIVKEIFEPPAVEKVFIWVSAAWQLPSVLVACLCARLAWKSWRHPITIMRGPVSVDALMRWQAQVHSPIAPLVPIAKDLHKNQDPRFHESHHPHEVVEMFGLLDANEDVDREKAEEYFKKQLGRRVFRPSMEKPDTIFADRLNNYEKTIFALLAPLAVELKAGLPKYEKLNDALNYSAVNPTQTPDLRLANDLYQEYRAHPKLNNLFSVHHFSVTYLMQLYMLAKRAGKISTSHWVGWLRPNANALYAALNTAGRSTPFTESAGAFTQWKFEQFCAKKGFAPILPCVVGAVEALEKEWNFYRSATVKDSEESLWGRMTADQLTDQELFRRYVTDILAPAMSVPPVSTSDGDSLFDQEQSEARRKHQEAEMNALMQGLKANTGNQTAT